MAIVAAMGVLAVVSGLVDRFNRWVPGRRIAPAVLVAPLLPDVVRQA
jgi:hypothetical protein